MLSAENRKLVRISDLSPESQAKLDEWRLQRAARDRQKWREEYPDEAAHIDAGIAERATGFARKKQQFESLYGPLDESKKNLWREWQAKQRAERDAAWEREKAAHDAWCAANPPVSARTEQPWNDDMSNVRAEAHKEKAITATPFVWVDPASIPERQWLYGRFLIRKHVSVTVAPPGTGKSSKEIVDALAMTSGRQLLHDKPYGVLRVWLWNGEEPADELQRRIAAAAIHHKLPPDSFVGRLFVDSGRNTEIKIARMDGSGTTIAKPVRDEVVATIRANRIDVLSIDPFVSSHAVTENDNNAIDAVTKEWAAIADETGCAIHLVHHPRKTNGSAVEAEDARGAGALIATARAARTLNVMSADEATKAGVDNRYFYVRCDDAKANMAPRSDAATWLKFENQTLGNGGVTGGDHVGVLIRWRWPDPMDGVTADDQATACAAVAAGEWRADNRADKWVGKAIAEALELDLDNAADKAKVSGLIKQWLAAGVLVMVERPVDGRLKKFVEVGQAKRQSMV